MQSGRVWRIAGADVQEADAIASARVSVRAKNRLQVRADAKLEDPAKAFQHQISDFTKSEHVSFFAQGKENPPKASPRMQPAVARSAARVICRAKWYLTAKARTRPATTSRTSLSEPANSAGSILPAP